MIRAQFWRFLLAGGVAAAANFGSRFVFSIFFEYGVAIFFAYLVGMLVAFLLMRGRVFDARNGSLVPQVSKFVVVNVLALLQTLVISFFLTPCMEPLFDTVYQAEALAHFVGVLVPVVTSYFGHKFFTFR